MQTGTQIQSAQSQAETIVMYLRGFLNLPHYNTDVEGLWGLSILAISLVFFALQTFETITAIYNM